MQAHARDTAWYTVGGAILLLNFTLGQLIYLGFVSDSNLIIKCNYLCYVVVWWPR